MSTTELFQIKKRIEPALVKPYIVDVLIFKEPDSFYTRLQGLFGKKTFKIYQVQRKRFLKKPVVKWVMTMESFVTPKGKILYGEYCPFGSLMSLSFESELDQMEAAVHLGEYFSKMLEEEFVKYQSVLKDKEYSESR